MIGNRGFQYIQSWFLLVLAVVGLFIVTAPCKALEPHEILVVANKNAARSVGLAKYYMNKRNIPQTNLVELWITDKEWCSRQDYEERAIYKVRKHLKEKDSPTQIRCLVSMYGVPLKVQPPELTDEQKRQAKDLRKRREILNNRIKTLDDSQKEQAKELKKELKTIEKRITVLTRRDQRASFDSELALVLRDNYSLSGWIPNPFFMGFKNEKLSREDVLLVSRLDGPSDKIVKRIIDDSIETEKTGLAGSAYFDARWKRPTESQNPKPKIDYAFYDRSIHFKVEEQPDVVQTNAGRRGCCYYRADK